MGQSFSFQRSSTSGVPLRQDEIDAQAADDDHDAHQLLQGDGLVQEQIGQNARSDGLAQNTHGHRRGRELVEQEVEDKLSPDGGYQRQSQKGQPGHICITHEGISLGQRIPSQRHGADTIAQDRVGDSRDFLPNGLPDEEVAG